MLLCFFTLIDMPHTLILHTCPSYLLSVTFHLSWNISLHSSFVILSLLGCKYLWILSTVCSIFLSRANEVSAGPTCQKVNVCVFVCLCSVFPVFFCNRHSRLLIDLTLWFLAYRLFRTLNPAIQEIGWAMPHSHFLAWLSSATLKIFIYSLSW